MLCSVTIITGPIDSGKTTAARNHLSLRTNAGGFLALGRREGPVKTGYLLQSLKTGEKRELLSSVQSDGCRPLGRFYLDPAVLDWAKEELLASLECEVIVVDELGPLELERHGYYDTVKFLLERYTGELVLVIRSGLLQPMAAELALPLAEVRIIDISGSCEA